MVQSYEATGLDGGARLQCPVARRGAAHMAAARGGAARRTTDGAWSDTALASVDFFCFFIWSVGAEVAA